jgi:hypothetical protein
MLTSNAEIKLTDASGICFPASAGCAADRMSSICVSMLYDSVLDRLSQLSVTACPTVVHFMEQTLALLQALPPWTRLQAFRPAVANYYLDQSYWQSDPAPSTLGVMRFLFGVPDLEFTAMIPAEAFTAQGLYLPHLHVRLYSDNGPVAVTQQTHSIHFTWTDGVTMTLPCIHGHAAVDTDAPRMAAGLWAQEWMILNGMLDESEPPLSIPVSPLTEVDSQDVETLLAGRELLQDVWPLAYAAVQRCYNAVLLQPYDDSSTSSISMNSLHGALIASARDPVQVGDALCHEGSHARMNLAFILDPLLENTNDEIHPSPWRNDLRPLTGLLNGIHAFLNVCQYYQRVMDTVEDVDGAAEIYEEQRRRVLEAWEYMAPRVKPTTFGALILQDMEAGVRELQ